MRLNKSKDKDISLSPKANTRNYAESQSSIIPAAAQERTLENAKHIERNKSIPYKNATLDRANQIEKYENQAAERVFSFLVTMYRI